MIREKDGAMVPLLNRLMRSRDYQEMLDLARPVIGNPLILANGTRTVMAITEETGIQDPRWLEISSTKGIPMGIMTYMDLNEAYRSSLESRRPVLTEVRESDDVPMLRKTLSVGDSILGYLDSPVYFKEPDEDDVEFFDFLGNLIALEMQRELGRIDLPDNMLDYFVYDLLEGHLTDEKLIQERLDYFGWNLLAKGKVQIVSIRGREQELKPDNTRFHRLLARFTTTFPLFRTFVYGSDLKMLCPVRESLEQDGGFCQSLEMILEEEGLVAGVSRPLLHLPTISDFNCQAERAAELGRVLRREKNIHFYDGYAVYHALELVADREDLYQFCHSAITLLRDYDIIHETELLESLRVYLTHNRSVGESAAALYIHRNTMNYRISRIQELTKLDMNDPDVFCHLLFSFYALDYRKLLGCEDPWKMRAIEQRQEELAAKENKRES